MNSLEDRARAAVRATASEIGPHDVPSMRPLGSGDDGGRSPGRQSGRGSSGGRGAGRAAWQWGVPLAAAAAVVTVIAAAGVLGGVSPSPASHPATATKTSKPGHHAVAAPAYPPHLEAGLTGFFLPASGAQYSAGALFTGQYRALQGQIVVKCMARHGFRVPSPGSPAELARGVWDLAQFPDLGAIAKAGALPSYSIGPTHQESKAYQQASMRCETTAWSAFAPMVKAGTALGGPWLTIVDRIQGSTAVNATLPELRDCATRYGWPHDQYGPDRPINSFGDFVNWVGGHIDGAGSRGASTADMNALNRHWGTVFVRCARPTIAVMERLQRAAQTKYLAEHQSQFAALVKIARADFARAERLARG